MKTARGGLEGRRVFVVEDEWMILTLLEDFLTAIGCEVAGTAARFEDAAEKAGTLAFDVAILDINLAGCPSFPLAEALAARGAAFLFATGYDSEIIPEPLRHVPVLQKPFQRWELERALREALALD